MVLGPLEELVQALSLKGAVRERDGARVGLDHTQRDNKARKRDHGWMFAFPKSELMASMEEKEEKEEKVEDFRFISLGLVPATTTALGGARRVLV